MFDIGFWELALIFVVALLVVGPQRLPGLVRSTAYWFGRARQMINDVKSEITDELDKAERLKRLIEEQNEMVLRNERQYLESLKADVSKSSDGGSQSSAASSGVQAAEAKSDEAEAPVMRAKPVPAAMNAPRPVGHGEAAAIDPVTTPKDEPRT